MTEPGVTQPRLLIESGHRHGKPSSWAVVAVAIAAFAVGGGALILGMWVVLYISAGVFVLTVPAGKLLGLMDDTVEYAMPSAGPRLEQLGQRADGHEQRH